jgi:hypothetical protein
LQPPPTEQSTVVRHVAALDYELAKADVLERLKFQATFAEIAWRSLTLVNGGAIVALFTFIGNARPAIDHSLIWVGFGCFAAGLVSNILSIMAGFFAQAFYMKSTTSAAWNKQLEMHGYEPQYAEVQVGEQRAGDRWEWTAIITAVASLLAFVAGAACALQGVTVGQLERDPAVAQVGRYHAVPNADGRGVYVLDSRTGQLRLCMTGPTNGPGTIGVACMSPSAAIAHN